MPTFERDGVRLHYELDGSGPPAVYISGFGAHSNDVLSAPLRQLMAEQYTVLAVDNRGSGQTVTPEGRPVMLADMADDIAAIMDHHGLGAAHILGISMGGCIAMLLALRHPDKVRSLVAAVSLAYSPSPSRAEFLVHTTRRMCDAGIPQEFINRHSATILLNEAIFEQASFIELWVNAPPDPLQQTALGYQQQVGALRGYDVRGRLPTLTVPTLVVSSPDDFLMPPHFQDEIASLIPGAEIKRYPGGHVFMLVPLYSSPFLADLFAFWQRHS